VPNTLYNNNVEVRNRSYNIPQEEIRTHQQQVPFYYQPYENFYSPQPGSVQPMDMKRDGVIVKLVSKITLRANKINIQYRILHDWVPYWQITLILRQKKITNT